MTEDGVDLLLVEDNLNDAQFIQRILTEVRPDDERMVQLGSVTHAEHLGELVELLQTDPDAVLLDLNLPDSDGIETVETLVEQAPHVPVVVITGRTEIGLGPKAIKAGAQDYLQKGRITAGILHRTLRYAIDRHQKQREIVELNRRLALLNRVVRQTIRDDVTMVVGRGDELRTHLDGDDERLADALVDSARHIVDRTDTASDLLTLLSTDTDPELEPLDLSEILDHQVTLLRERSSADVTVHQYIDQPVTVTASPSLGAVFEQLFSNALEHNDSDHPAVEVTVEPTPERIRITVADNGVGISDTQRALLNDPDARYHERSGIGTGLYLVLTVVELSGGEVQFADNDPHGTAVTVTVPRADGD